MPKFRCLGKEFSINATDLERAPDSVLAEAWKTGDHHTDSVVELGAWPEPDLESLEVRACRTCTAQTMLSGSKLSPCPCS